MWRKKYLYLDVPIPRSTLYRRRKEEQQRRRAARAGATVSQGSESLTSRVNASEQVTFPDNEDALGQGQADCNHQFTDDFGLHRQLSPLLNSQDRSSSSESEHSGKCTIPGSERCSSSDTEEYDEHRSPQGTAVDYQADAQDSNPIPHDDMRDHIGDCAGKTFKLDTPLNALTPATDGDALLLCLALGLRHSLSWLAIVDILRVVNILFDHQAVKDSKYYVMKYTNVGIDSTVYHIYCPICERYLGQKQSGSQAKLECACGWDLMDVNQASTFFLSLGLEKQIRDLLKDPVFIENLNYRFVRQKLNKFAYEDIFDGQLYQRYFIPGGILNEKFNMSYTFNTDGCPIGKASRQTCWPIYIQINELPPNLRSKYMLLVGIYVGRKEPNMKIFLEPFVKEANFLSTTGIKWINKGIEINSKVIPLCACLDSVARCKVLNMTQFNGWYGCTLCLHKAEHTKSGLRYTLPIRNFRERTHNEILECAKQAHRKRSNCNPKKSIVKGVKGPSPIHNLRYLDLVEGVRPDPMHSMFLGNAKLHTDIMMKSYGKIYYIGCEDKVNIITKRLLSIRPPSSITRTPRGLKELSLWKAAEWRSWLLFYGVVCLFGIIDDSAVIHFSMLSSAAHILLQKSILPDDLDRAYHLILRFIYCFQETFGKTNMVYNVHLLLHVKKSVQYLGPLWTHSAFGFEGENRFLLQLKKNPSSVALEIARKYLTFRSLPLLCEKYASLDSAVEFCEELSGKSLKYFVRCGKLLLIGRGRTLTVSAHQSSLLAASGFLNNYREIRAFDRMLYGGVRYTTAIYSLGHKSDDSYIWLTNGKSRGRIEQIFKITDGDGDSHVAIVFEQLKIQEFPIFDDEYGSMCPIRRVEGNDKLTAIKPSDIGGQCIAMYLDNGNYICDLPYGSVGD